jgi:hypothetical protein
MAHCAELVEFETPSAFTHPILDEQNWPWRIEGNGYGAQKHNDQDQR